MSKLYNPILENFVQTGDIVVNHMGKAYVVVDKTPKNGMIWVHSRCERKVYGHFPLTVFGLEVKE